MDDLLLGAAIMAAIGWGVFRVTQTASEGLSWYQQNLVAVLILLGMAGYGGWLWNRAMLAGWLPFSNLVIVSNWFPIFLLALAGVVIDMREMWCWRRRFLLTVIVSFAAFAMVYPLLGVPPQCGDKWSRSGDCLQTTPYTCSAASAATLLRAHGIEATEQEMAELCLTREGTSWMGLYRGLTLKTNGTLWRVEVLDWTPEQLLQASGRPLLIDVGLPHNLPADNLLVRDSGFLPGVPHSVVLWGAQGEPRLIVSDPTPAIGREEWNAGTLRYLYRGRAIRLVERFPLPEHLRQLAAK
jgi:hypothetical protein